MKAVKFTRGKLILILLACSAFGVLAYYAATTGRLVPEDQLRAQEEEIEETLDRRTELNIEFNEVRVYTLVPGQAIEFESRMEVVPEGVAPLLYATNSFIDSLGFEASVRAVDSRIDGSLATLEFGEGVYKGYGSMEEIAFIRGLLATAAQFEGVERLQILVNGQPIESLGHLEIMDPIPVSEQFVASP